MDLSKFIELVNNNSLEVSEGVFLSCGEIISCEIYAENGDAVIDIKSPDLYIKVDENASFLDRIKIKAISPRLDKVIIKKNQIVIKLNPIGEISYAI